MITLLEKLVENNKSNAAAVVVLIAFIEIKRKVGFFSVAEVLRLRFINSA
jgi:hypothetical protein